MVRPMLVFLVAVATSLGADRDPQTIPRLPEGCDPLIARVSPDGRRVGFVGGYTPPVVGEAKRHGLFVVDLATKNVRLLIERDIKNPPAWSPDSRRLAVGDADGYGTRYPLVIVDAETGAIDRTGVMGAGPAWSPDGRFVAVSTGFHQGGSWTGGVPADGQIGLYDTQDRRMSPLTPPGFNFHDIRTGDNAMRGAIGPAWSPDGRRVAFRLFARSHQGAEKVETQTVWIVDRDGANLRRVLEGTTHDARWSPDGARLTIEGSKDWPGGTVEVATLPIVGPDAMPSPPAPLVAAMQEAEQAAVRARAFDVAPVLAANRAWMVPASGQLRSVGFVHMMEPRRLDERFQWRSDGAILSEVARYKGEDPERYRGKATVVAPGGMKYSFTSGSRYPRAEAQDAGKARAEALGYLMGTRMTFVAQGWGRDPEGFEVRDARRADDGSTITLELIPRRSRSRDEFRLNAGIMFDRSSWAYVHDLRIGRAEIAVDVATLRVLREVDFDFDGKVIAEVDLGDWVEADAGRSVPGRVRVRFPGQKFSVDDHFAWHPEGLWLLRSGESRSDGMEPQRETIADLTLNAPLPALESFLDRAARETALLDAPVSAPTEARPITVGPVALGKRIALAGGMLESLTLTFPEVSDEPPGRMVRWDHPDLHAVLSRAPAGKAPQSVLLVLYDEGGRPVGMATTPFPVDQTMLDLNLGGYWTLGDARSWSLTAFADDGPRRVAPAEWARTLPVGATVMRPGMDRVVQVDAEAGLGRDRKTGPTRLRSLRLAGDGPDARNVEVELVGRDTWKDIATRTTVVLLDGQDIPVAAGSLDHEFRVEEEVYDNAKLVVPLCGSPGGAGDTRIAAGLRTVVVGAPMTSLWGRYAWFKCPYPTRDLLASDDPVVWRRGLTALDVESSLTLGIRRSFDSESAVFREKGWATIHRAVRPHVERLAALFPKAGEQGPRVMAHLCLLAGHSGDARLVGPLRTALDDPDESVRDMAAIGLGLLGRDDARARLDAIVARPVSTPTSDLTLRQAAARRALAVLDGERGR